MGKIDIPLRIYGTRSETLTFLIRSQPEHGRLTEPNHFHPQGAVVTYEPPKDLNINADKFTYAVRSKEGVSAAVDVNIQIIDEEPKLLVPDALEFPALLIGETAERNFQITNRGGGIALGEIKVDPPYSVVGSPRYELGADEQAVFTILFAPTKGGDFRNEVRFSSQIDRTMLVTGIGRAPLAVTPERLELRRADQAPARMGVFQLTNNTAEPLELTLTASDRLTLPRQLTLATGEQKVVPVQMNAGDVGPFEEEIRIEHAGATILLPIKAAPVSAILRVDPRMVTFGKVSVGRQHRAEIHVENIGGSPVRAVLHVPAPFTVEKNTLTLDAGGREAVGVTLSPALAGAIQAVLQIESSAGRVDVPLQAEAREPG
jgi:hypothetical protein